MKAVKALSIVIPAHNEEAVIGACLRMLLNDACDLHLEVIVVCNGCDDKTATVAREFDIKVIEIDERSKIAALNAGDQAATCFPRVYLDADIRVTASDLLSSAMVLNEKVMVTAPEPVLDLAGSSWAVKAFYKVWTQLPYYSSGHMVGSGIYILSEAGRGRFGRFPSIIADDGYVRGLFEFDEIATDKLSSFQISAPTRLKDLIAIRTRARFGNIELLSKYPHMQVAGDNSRRAFFGLVTRNPALIAPALVYVLVQLATYIKCWTKLKKSDYHTWERDDSSRQYLAEASAVQIEPEPSEQI